MHYEDDDPPIKSHPASKEYRDNYDTIDWGEDIASRRTDPDAFAERRERPRLDVECSTCGAKNEAPCDDDIHETTGKPLER